jgi:hypothetical protein
MKVWLILRMIKAIQVNGSEVPIKSEGKGIIGIAPVVDNEEAAISWTGKQGDGYIQVDIPSTEDHKEVSK